VPIERIIWKSQLSTLQTIHLQKNLVKW
jgi:hypothetical protein